ncbi:RNA polymerase sigma factor [Desulforamulus aeronauticus]|uniref:RNA polymerase sigma-70 factor, ECF subfamily n=1 Tax=Desulforamulus aeronauticus DSM 10349 TaxID=1121421 RepID=A0A1M6UWG4_9FIRM|nr:RNA polymerase sigma factor [Desulforamulus aeronauticus]SHK73520.1 RNA polymerase sigma-70 factor, ECF subfamily [Desulforamulus aeronauticus DSM 10349]
MPPSNYTYPAKKKERGRKDIATLDISQSLIDQAIQGNSESFETIVRLTQSGIYNLAFRILNNREEAQDATQEAFVKLYQALPSFRGEARFTSWFYRIATNVCLDCYRRNKKKRENTAPEYMEHLLLLLTSNGQNSNPEQIYQDKQKLLRLQKAIDELPVKYRTVIVLRHMEGFSYQEIAEIMQVPVQTVGTFLYRGKAVLLKKLNSSKEGGIRVERV